MKNELKRACTFYLGSWWLPPAVLAFFFTAYWFSFSIFIWNTIPVGTTQETDLGTLTNKMAFHMMIFTPLILLAGLGVLVSWIWILFHKRWLHFLLSILSIPAALIAAWILIFVFSAIFTFPKIMKKIKTTQHETTAIEATSADVPDATQTQGDEE